MRTLTITHDGIGESGLDDNGKYAWHDFVVRDDAGDKVAALCLYLTDYDYGVALGTGDGGWSDLTDEELDSLRADAADLAEENGGCAPE